MTKSEAFQELRFAAGHFTGRISKGLENEILEMTYHASSRTRIASMFNRIADEVEGNAGVGAVQRLRDVADDLEGEA